MSVWTLEGGEEAVAMLERLKRFFGGGQEMPGRRLELTVADQWVLKFLFLVRGRAVGEEDIVAAVREERPSLIPHEVLGALRKLRLVGVLERDDLGRYRINPKARKLKEILPEQPGVSIDYYG